ncbi:MAG: glycosyltransferase, partial [Candidatus Nanopelagicales bacterium]
TAVSTVAASQISASVGAPVGVLPNGIDADAWRASAPWRQEPGVLRVVSVLRLAPRKRVGALLRVLARASVLLGPDVRVQACLIGDGPERSRAERLAGRLGLDIDFAGRLAREGITERFAQADVFAQASVRESFGIAALEARTFGLPVVARSQTGTGEFIADGVNGLLAGDDAALADALALLGRDPGLLARMRSFNETHPPDQDWTSVCDRAQAFYRQAGAAGGSA